MWETIKWVCWTDPSTFQPYYRLHVGKLKCLPLWTFGPSDVKTDKHVKDLIDWVQYELMCYHPRALTKMQLGVATIKLLNILENIRMDAPMTYCPFLPLQD